MATLLTAAGLPGCGDVARGPEHGRSASGGEPVAIARPPSPHEVGALEAGVGVNPLLVRGTGTAETDAAVAFGFRRETHSVRDSAGIRIVESAEPALAEPWTIDPVPLVRIGTTAGAPEYELFRVAGALRLEDGRIVIANGGTAQLRWYAPTGAFLRASGRTGDGPGEFRLLATIFRLPGDSVAAYDIQARRVTIFDQTGELVRSVTLNLRGGALSPRARFADGTYLLAPSGYALGADGPVRVERSSMEVFRASEEGGGEVITVLPGIEFVVVPAGGVRADGTPTIGRTPRPFGRSTSVAGAGNGWVAGDNDRAEVQYRTTSGEATILARWLGPRRPVTDAEVRAYVERRVAGQPSDERRQRLRASLADYPAPPAEMPAFSGLTMDREGNVWVAEYPSPSEVGASLHMVLNREGVWLTTVVAPPGMRLLDIGVDYVVGVSRDELDVETVTVHRLERL